jgi:very-short-patch-repair endonuclease
MSSENYDEYKAYDLKEMCKERGITGYSKLRKEKVVKLLKDDDEKKTDNVEERKKTKIRELINRRGTCNNKKETLLSKYPEIAKEWHPTKNEDNKPNELSYGSSKKVWWLCSNKKDCNCNHEWESTIDSRRNGSGCPYCNRKKFCYCNSLEGKYPEIAKEWHPTKNGDNKPNELSYGSNQKVWWLCSNISKCEKCNYIHEWEAIIANRTDKNSGCPYCNGGNFCFCNSLEGKYPEIAKEWHPTKNGYNKPSDFSYGTHQKIWWLCSNKNNSNYIHEWEATIANRTKGTGCPYCINKTEGILKDFLQNHYLIETQFKKDWCKNITYLPFDFCIEELKIIIELDGGQHFNQVVNWYSPEIINERDRYKMKCANENGFSVIRIVQEDVWDNKYEWKKEILENIEKIKNEGKVQNVFMCKNSEYDIFN